jgi:hypothetical protein
VQPSGATHTPNLPGANSQLSPIRSQRALTLGCLSPLFGEQDGIASSQRMETIGSRDMRPLTSSSGFSFSSAFLLDPATRCFQLLRSEGAVLLLPFCDRSKTITN